jgi:hypothetical protein
MNKTLITLFLFLLVFSFVAQAEMVETTRWSATNRIVVRGIAAGNFDEATQTLYAATSNNEDDTPDNVWATFPCDILELTTPAKLRATFTYNVPISGIAGQVNASMVLTQGGGGVGGGVVEITEPTTFLDGTVQQEKIIRLVTSSRDQTNSIVSKNVLPAGRYWAYFEIRVPGAPLGGRMDLRADAISGARLVSIRLETFSGAAPPASKSAPRPKSIPRL